MNAKAAAAVEKKAQNDAVKNAKSAADKERQTQQEWSVGANNRGTKRAESAAAKADEAARKRQEKAALLAEEEANLGPGGKVKRTSALSKKKKKGNDLSLLEDALVGAADKKVKAKKRAEREKQEKLKQERLKKEEADAAKVVDPLLANTNAMLAGTEDQLVGRAANKAMDEDGVAASGLDGALNSLSLSGGGEQIRSAKALYKAFEQRMMPEMKEDYPGLKLSQYKEKIFNLWKKSPENPANRPS
eukprot:CAMPEP_0198130894 /NCGR_PEP_ID=MMETSP1442-20131203/54928_1 /TAXON_ID= /ORGANISM="Craspedostauros australis, Strain CCMP3328" /LENGTH=245 /DNA_ID=CAMNT_0043791595 /DNA_START=210 /DNA_END=947 /DNA_ORIENTATION=-